MPSQFHWSVQLVVIAKLQHQPASTHSHTQSLAHTYTQTHKRARILTSVYSIQALDIFDRLFFFAWCSYSFKPRFLLLFPLSSYILFYSIYFIFALILLLCLFFFFFLPTHHLSPLSRFFLSLTFSEWLICEIRMCALLLQRRCVHCNIGFRFFFLNFLSNGTLLKLNSETIGKNQK